MKNFIAHGDTVEFTAGADYSAGDGVVIGTVFGVVVNDVANGAKGLAKLTGVFRLPKAASQPWTVGAAIHWSAGSKACTTSAVGNRLIGFAVEAVGSGAGETLGVVRLNGIAGVGNAVAVGS